MADSNRRTLGVISYGPNPLTVAMVGALDAARGLAASGRMGGVRQGLSGTGSRKFSGEVGPLQQFRGYAGPLAGRRDVRAPRGVRLPMTGAPFDGSSR